MSINKKQPPPSLPSTNTNNDNVSSITDEYKDQNVKYNLSKFEYDLFHDEDNTPKKVISIKRLSLPNDGERWKIFEDSKAMFVIEGAKLTGKQREFLRTVDGVTFLISQYKAGIKSFNALKSEIKKILQDRNA